MTYEILHPDRFTFSRKALEFSALISSCQDSKPSAEGQKRKGNLREEWDSLLTNRYNFMGFSILVYGALTADGAVFHPAALEGSKKPRFTSCQVVQDLSNQQ